MRIEDNPLVAEGEGKITGAAVVIRGLESGELALTEHFYTDDLPFPVVVARAEDADEEKRRCLDFRTEGNPLWLSTHRGLKGFGGKQEWFYIVSSMTTDDTGVSGSRSSEKGALIAGLREVLSRLDSKPVEHEEGAEDDGTL